MLSRTGEGRRDRGKTITKAHECERLSSFKRSPVYVDTGYAGGGVVRDSMRHCWESLGVCERVHAYDRP